MLQVARLAPRLLGDAAGRVRAFLEDSFHADGGGRNREGASDLYYTVFALEGLIALRSNCPRPRPPALKAGDGDGIDRPPRPPALPQAPHHLPAGRRRPSWRTSPFQNPGGCRDGGSWNGSVYHAPSPSVRFRIWRLRLETVEDSHRWGEPVDSRQSTVDSRTVGGTVNHGIHSQDLGCDPGMRSCARRGGSLRRSGDGAFPTSPAGLPASRR
jgi:hypothetical protein